MSWIMYTSAAGCLPDAEPDRYDTIDDLRDALRTQVELIADDYADALTSMAITLRDPADAGRVATLWAEAAAARVDKIVTGWALAIPHASYYALRVEQLCDGSGVCIGENGYTPCGPSCRECIDTPDA
jgi:hypothetical protein